VVKVRGFYRGAGANPVGLFTSAALPPSHQSPINPFSFAPQDMSSIDYSF